MPKVPIVKLDPNKCIACSGRGQASKGGKCGPCKGTGIKQAAKASEGKR